MNQRAEPASREQNRLDNKLQDVLTAINGGQTATACSEVTDFIGHVQSQSGKGLTTDQANQLLAAAGQVQAVLGCQDAVILTRGGAQSLVLLQSCSGGASTPRKGTPNMYQLPTLRLSSWARLVTLSLLLLVGLLASLGLASRTVHAQPAATLTVTDCSGETGPGRIGTVISSASPGDTIKFSCSGTIPITSHLVITESMTLDGSGQMVTLDGGGSTQVLQVKSGVSFTLKALTIAHGFWGCDTCDGGGLFNEGMLTITNSTFSGNSANEFGGGLANENGGTVSISTSTFSGNSAPNGVGGGLYNNGTVTISTSTFSGNSAYSGGGLANDGTVSISTSTFSGNTANNSGAQGGGLWNAGTVSVSGSTFSGNSSADGGGGLDSEGGTVTINSSTFTNNSAAGTDDLNGGGIRNAFSSTVSITNSTFSGNTSADRGGALHNGAGSTANISSSTFSGNTAPSGNGGGLSNDGTVSIGGSIVATNTGGDCNQLATLHDQGYNLSSDNSCSLTGTGSVQNTNPRLGPLASNGGPTQTLALLKGSPAIDYIPLASALCPATDQRGHKRPDNPLESACDIGAYES
jgi:hypothetical protein